MADAITIAQLIEASEDAQSLSLFVNADAATQVPRRLADPIETLEYWRDYMGNLATGKDGESIVFDDLTQAQKDEIRGADGLDGSYTLKGYSTYELMIADAANIPTNTSVNVTNDTDSTKNGMYAYDGTAFTKSAYDPLTQSKLHTDAYATVVSKTIADSTNFDNLKTEGVYKVVSNSSAMTMTNCPSIRAGALEVLAISTTLIVQRYTPYNVEKKVFVRASNNGVFDAVWSEVLFKAQADSLYTTPSLVNSAINGSSSATVNALTQSDYYGKKYSDAELNGNSIYPSGYYVGYNSIYDSAILFKTLEGRVFNTTSGAIEYRIYLGDKLDINVNGYQVSGQTNIANPDFSGICENFPSSDSGIAQSVTLDKVISIPANTPFAIIFKAPDSTKFGIAYAPTVTSNLESRSFNLSATSGDWSAQTRIGCASVANGYVQSGFKLIVTMTVSDSNAVIDSYAPTLVMPPKIYALANLQAHIYPEHLTPEPHDLYLHDVTCLRGKQTERGWVYDVPTSQAAGNITLSYALHDKQTGDVLNMASATLVIADQTKTGTKNVMVIGDSYVNAGVITQRLLDISDTDTLKTTLIGTRGTAPNKHEGRGGWKVSDYATVGRNDYKFTVSGLVTPPAINSTVYGFDGRTYLVQEVSLSGGAGYFIASLFSGSAPSNLGVSGTLTKSNTGTGDTTVAFSNIESVSANPFWLNGTLNFSQYLTNNALATPDIVLIQLGVNDSFGMTNDSDVETLTTTAFAQLDSLITSIKASNAAVKIGIVSPPTYANQDAFGISYASNQTTWRAKRNIVTWNKKLYAYFANKETQNVYVVPTGLNVDTESNFPTTTQATNSHNSTVITVQNNGVHPDASGYKQIGDSMFAWIKAVS